MSDKENAAGIIESMREEVRKLKLKPLSLEQVDELEKRHKAYVDWCNGIGKFAVTPKAYLPVLHSAFRKYQYDRTVYWYPLEYEGHHIEKFDRFFIMENRLITLMEKVFDVLFQNNLTTYYVPLYSIDSHVYHMSRNALVENMHHFAEYACMPEDTSWLYYKGHEGTVTFAGSIIGPVRELTKPVQQYWNVYAGG